MRKRLVFIFPLFSLIVFSLWFAPRPATTQTVTRGLIIRDQSGKPTHIYSRALGQYLPVNDVRDQIAELSKNAHRDKKFERGFLESKKALIKANPNLSDDEKRIGIERINKIISRTGLGKGSPPLPQPIEPIDPPDDPPDYPPVINPPPPPGGIGFGILYNESYRTAFTGGSVVDYNIVAPQTAGGNNGTWLYLTATNRAGECVEAFPLYYGQSNVEFKIFDWARAHRNLNPWVVSLPFSAIAHNYYTIGICDAPNPPCGGSVPFHFYQVLGLWNATYQKQWGSNTWTNEVYLLNPPSSWDFIWSYDYESSLAQQQCAGCAWWGPIVETFQDNYSNMNVMGYANAWAEALTPGGSQDSNYPLSPFNGYNTNMYGPSQGWQLLSRENVDLNNGFLVH
ncbi:MAG TPA: DUF1542 domain-containing protein [Pyrinomonadaceae bacterium]|nr:DUF1542 domain-containing protein [Pyrinomonadaceae bacterium]